MEQVAVAAVCRYYWVGLLPPWSSCKRYALGCMPSIVDLVSAAPASSHHDVECEL
jgi:hypothetical protein